MVTSTDDIHIPTLATQLNTLTTSNFENETDYKSLFEAAGTFALALETPEDSVQRIAYTIRIYL